MSDSENFVLGSRLLEDRSELRAHRRKEVVNEILDAVFASSNSSESSDTENEDHPKCENFEATLDAMSHKDIKVHMRVKRETVEYLIVRYAQSDNASDPSSGGRLPRLLKGPLQSQQGYMATVHHDFHINLKNNPIGDKTKYSDGYADMNNNTYMSYYHKDGSVANNNRSKARDKSGGINKFSNEMESKCMDLTKNLVYIFEAIGGSNRSSNINIGKYLIPGSKRTIENVFNDYNRNKNSYIKSVKNNDRNAKNNKINHKWSNTYNNNDKNSNNDNINNSNGNINNNNQSNIINKNKRNYNSTNKSNNSNSDVDIDILFN